MLNDPSAWVALLGIPLIVVTILIAAWLNNRRIDSVDSSLNHRIDDLNNSLNRRIDDLGHRVDILDRPVDELSHRVEDLSRRVDSEVVPLLREILSVVKDLDRRVTALEQRPSPIVSG